jgi:hypothetical protein
MRNAAVVVLFVALAGPAQAQSAQVNGTLGYLSEWEVSATVTENLSSGQREFSGPLVIRHIGVCTPGHPVEMSGEIRYRITGWLTPRMQATLVIEGVECGFDGKLSQTYDGAISCDKWRGVPLSLSVKSANRYQPLQ